MRLKAAISLLTRSLIDSIGQVLQALGPNSKHDGWQFSDELTP